MIHKYPLIINNHPNMRVSFDDYKVLYYCNGLTDIDTIIKKTGFPNLKVIMTINKFSKKGKMKVKYIINME